MDKYKDRFIRVASMGLFPAKHYPPHPAVKVPSLLPHPGHHTLNVLRATTNWAFRSRGAFTRWAVTGLIGACFFCNIYPSTFIPTTSSGGIMSLLPGWKKDRVNSQV